MDIKVYEYNAEIKKHEGIDGAYVEFPYDVEVEFGLKGQVKVKASFDGFEYRGSLAKMGYSCHFLGMTKAVRSEIGKKPGDTVNVKIMQDIELRVVEVPEDLEKRLDENQAAKAFFEGLSYTNQKDYVFWITSAKKEETRGKRLGDALDKLSRGMKLK